MTSLSIAHAGFPSPAGDYAESGLSLDALLIRNPPATFLFRVEGASMRDFGILDGDIAVVDRSVDPQPGMTVIAVVDDGFVIKHLARRDGAPVLRSGHPDYPDLPVTDDPPIVIWGVVRHVIHTLLGQVGAPGAGSAS